MMPLPEIYVTSFCNFAHRLDNGRPIDHECYVLPTMALQAERDGNHDLALELLANVTSRKVVRGRKLKGTKP